MGAGDHRVARAQSEHLLLNLALPTFFLSDNRFFGSNEAAKLLPRLNGPMIEDGDLITQRSQPDFVSRPNSSCSKFWQIGQPEKYRD
jgi:hypothetical protein